MSLQRRDTRFGILSIRGATPDSDENESSEAGRLPAASDNDSSNKLKRPWVSLDEEGPSKTRRPSDRFIPQAVQPKVGTIRVVRIQHSSPWESLIKHFSLSLEDSVTIATRKDGLFVAVREFLGPDADQKVRILQRIQQENLPNFLALQECFSFEGSLYAVFEHELTRNEKLLSLGRYALIKRYPTESQLAFILEQVLNGLEYLASRGFEHGAVRCKNILISTDGNIRIAGQECCREIGSRRGSVKDIRGIGYVTMELMHKEAKYDGPIQVRDVSRWPLDSKAVQFLLITESAHSIEELAKHPLFTYKRRESVRDDLREYIRANVYRSEFSVFRGNDEE